MAHPVSGEAAQAAGGRTRLRSTPLRSTTQTINKYPYPCIIIYHTFHTIYHNKKKFNYN